MATGLPDASTLATYGGAKINSRPVVNPQTDRDATAANQAYADAAGCSRTAIRAWVLMSLAVNTAGLVLLDWDAVWKASTPTLPTLTQLATGVFQVAFPTQVVDELGATHTLAFRRAIASIASGTVVYHTIATAAPNTSTIQVFTVGTSTANNAAGVSLYVEIA